MSGRDLARLAHDAGLSVEWIDAFGTKHTVSDDTLRSVLAALGFPANTDASIRDSRRRLREEGANPSATIVATSGQVVTIRAKAARAELVLEDGKRESVALDRRADGSTTFRAPATAGYHHLELDGRAQQLVVAPKMAFHPPEERTRLWGIAVQLYSLRGGKTHGFGDFAALAEFAALAARAGADAITVSPVHAGVAGPFDRYSPYSPSTRLFLEPMFASVRSGNPRLDRSKLIAWRPATEAKIKSLRHAYDRFRNERANGNSFEHFVRDGGPRLLCHARFQALHERFHAEGIVDWRSWPHRYRSARSPNVTRLDRRDAEVERHLYWQWLADQHLAWAQANARDAGMAIGLVGDLAIGMDPRGSHAWSAPHEILNGLSIGAPPDPLGPNGQDWGLTALSPSAFRKDGYGCFIATLRAAMRHAGGLRIDHAMGLQRLWVIPSGAPSSAGVYLRYPFEDLLRLITLESVRHRTLVIGEDLGTVPPGFRARMARAGLLGMRVLYFERDRDGGFKHPADWDKDASALSTTHDLPPIAGWWRGRDIEWHAKLSPAFKPSRARRERAKDKMRLWRSMKRENFAKGRMPGPHGEQQIVDAALAFVARTPAELAIVPIEDIVGVIEQPNLPGTVDEHPNWRRRLPERNGLASPRAQRRLKVIADERPKP